MKFDPTKPYGQVYGHHAASYEQGGILFSGSGEPIPIEDLEEPQDEEKVPEETELKSFLGKILEGGPVSQANVYKEAGAKNHNWADVKTVAASMNVRIRAVKGKAVWSLI